MNCCCANACGQTLVHFSSSGETTSKILTTFGFFQRHLTRVTHAHTHTYTKTPPGCNLQSVTASTCWLSCLFKLRRYPARRPNTYELITVKFLPPSVDLHRERGMWGKSVCVWIPTSSVTLFNSVLHCTTCCRIPHTTKPLLIEIKVV